jgi:hypothetical protein
VFNIRKILLLGPINLRGLPSAITGFVIGSYTELVTVSSAITLVRIQNPNFKFTLFPAYFTNRAVIRVRFISCHVGNIFQKVRFNSKHARKK